MNGHDLGNSVENKGQKNLGTVENVIQTMCLWGKNRLDLMFFWKMTFQVDVVLTQVRIGRHTDNEATDDNILPFIKHTHQRSN